MTIGPYLLTPPPPQIVVQGAHFCFGDKGLKLP